MPRAASQKKTSAAKPSAKKLSKAKRAVGIGSAGRPTPENPKEQKFLAKKDELAPALHHDRVKMAKRAK